MKLKTPARVASLIAVAVFSLASAGCGGVSEDSTSGPPQDGVYAGVTDQGLPIRMLVKSGEVANIEYGWRTRCEDGEVHTNAIVIAGGKVENGLFSAGSTLATGGVGHVDGDITGTEASGTLSRSKGSAFGTDCLLTGVHWKADFDPDAAPGDLNPGPEPGTPGAGSDSGQPA